MTVHRHKFLIIKLTRCTNFSNLFLERNYMFRTVPLSIIRSSSLYKTMVYVIQVCWQLASRMRMGLQSHPHPALARYQQTCLTYTIACFLQWQKAGSGWDCSLILILLASCQQTCMTYSIAVCTVGNSWWWTEELSETCRISFQNKFEKLVHLVGFIVRKFTVCTLYK
jgi:hypothetical protein